MHNFYEFMFIFILVIYLYPGLKTVAGFLTFLPFLFLSALVKTLLEGFTTFSLLLIAHGLYEGIHLS